MVQMKRTATALIIVTALFLLAVAQLRSVAPVKANPSPGPIQVFISSPTSYGKYSNMVLLNVSVMVFQDSLNGSENRWIAFSLDNQNNNTMLPHYQGVSVNSGFRFSVVTAMEMLWVPDGWHNITVYAKYNYGGWISEGSQTIQFTVGFPTNAPPTDWISPTIALNHPSQNQVFEEYSIIPYSITVSFPSSWFNNGLVSGRLISICYVLDNTDLVVIGDEMSAYKTSQSLLDSLTEEKPYLILTGNLSALPIGTHTIEAYAACQYSSDENQKTIRSGTTYFSIGNQTFQPLVVAFTVSATIIGLGLFVYFKKHKRNNEPKIS